MNARDEATVSLWMNIDVAPDAARLAVHEKADVAVIGSGIAGLSIAYELAAQGLDVAVVDRGIVASGMSARTSAHLTASSDDGFETLIRTRGLEGAKTYYASHAAAMPVRIVASAAEIRMSGAGEGGGGRSKRAHSQSPDCIS